MWLIGPKESIELKLQHPISQLLGLTALKQLGLCDPVVCIGGGGLAEWTRGGHVFFSGPWTAVLQYLALISLDFTCCSSQQQDVGLLPAVSPAAPEEGYQEIKE